MWKEKETVGGNEIKTWNVIQNMESGIMFA